MSNPYNESPEAARARRGRNWVLAVALLAFVALVFAITVAKISGNAGIH